MALQGADTNEDIIKVTQPTPTKELEQKVIINKINIFETINEENENCACMYV